MNFHDKKETKIFEVQVKHTLEEYKHFFETVHVDRRNSNDLMVKNILTNTDSDGQDVQRSEADMSLARLTVPPVYISRLVLIMIRHTLLITCYLIFRLCRSGLHQIIPRFSSQTAITEILMNITIYMMYPVGDSAYQLFCFSPTNSVFEPWFNNYMEKRQTIIDHTITHNSFDNANCDLSDKIHSNSKQKPPLTHSITVTFDGDEHEDGSVTQFDQDAREKVCLTSEQTMTQQ